MQYRRLKIEIKHHWINKNNRKRNKWAIIRDRFL